MNSVNWPMGQWTNLVTNDPHSHAYVNNWIEIGKRKLWVCSLRAEIHTAFVEQINNYFWTGHVPGQSHSG